MKINRTSHRRAVTALVPTLLVLAAPAVAQEAQTTTAPASVTPPPVVSTAPQSAPASSSAAPTIVRGPSTPVVQQIPTSTQPASDDTAVRRAAPAKATRAPVRSATARPLVAHSAPAPAPKAVAAPAPAPAAAAPEPEPKQAAPVAQTPPPAADQAAPAAATDNAKTTTTDTAQNTTEGTPVWMWLVPVIVVLLAIGGLIFARRRRPEDAYVEPEYVEPAYAEPAYVTPEVAVEPVVEPVYVEPAPIVRDEPLVEAAAPLAVAPLVTGALRREERATNAPVAQTLSANDEDATVAVAEDAAVVQPDAADVDALTAGNPPVSDRPWLEMAMRPVRAGTSAEDALVEIELTIGNAGTVAADDVRISTFMFAGEPDNAEMERLLIDRDASAVPPVTIKPGEGTTVEATLALSREALDGEASPVIVANARYPLPGGGEGRTSASFRIGVSQEDGTISPIQIGRPHMTQTVDAELYGTPERV